MVASKANSGASAMWPLAFGVYYVVYYVDRVCAAIYAQVTTDYCSVAASIEV